jgi:hypothetical protein
MSTLLERLAQFENQEADDLYILYNSLLARSEDLNEDEVKELFAIAHRLGKTRFHVHEDRSAMIEFERESALAAKLDELQETAAQLNAEVLASREAGKVEIDRINREHSIKVEKARAAGSALIRAGNANHHSADLILKHWRVLGLPDPALTAPEPLDSLLKRSGVNAAIEGAKITLSGDIPTPAQPPLRVVSTVPHNLGGGPVAGSHSPINFVPSGGDPAARSGDPVADATKGLASLL